MRIRSVVVATIFLVLALLLQRSAFAQLDLPGAAPDLLVIVVVAFAVLRGPLAGCVVGFAAGLLADLAPPADHAVGRLALVFCLTGYLAGLVRDEAERSAFMPMVVVAVAATFVVLFDAGLGRVFGDPHVTWSAIAHLLPAAVLYDVLLTPFVVPVIGFLDGRADSDSRR
jgi:rod shape-determining protein MreD